MAITLDGTNGITTPDLTVDTDTLVVDEANDRVGIGTSSPWTKLSVYGSGNQRIAVTSPTGGGTVAALDLSPSLTAGEAASYDPQARIYAVDSNYSANIIFANKATGAAGNSLQTRMTLDSSGNLLVGTTSNPTNALVYLSTSGADWKLAINDTNSGTQSFTSFRYNGTGIGSITGNNTSTSYNTSSDYRLKENVVGVTGASARVQQLNPVRFNFIADPDRTVDGFLAHEVQDVVPEAITGTKDAVDAEGNPEYQGIDQSKLVPLLTAALQEALGKIETLEARVAALEAA